MEKSKKHLTITLISLTVLLIIVGCLAFSMNSVTASAATKGDTQEAEPMGLMTKISLSIGVSGTTMWARAHNDFTLGFSTIQVYVELYSSLDYQDSYANMKLEGIKYISDLNINKTLETTAKINGVKRYWRARARYKMDSKDWVSDETKTYLVDENGMMLG